MNSRHRLVFDAREDAETSAVVERIADQIAEGDESGTIHGESDEPIDWELQTTGGGLEIDRRQRLAAAALLMGFDLPQEMHAASITMIEAAQVCPGMTTGDITPMGEHGRREALTFARDLIDRMLAEIA